MLVRVQDQKSLPRCLLHNLLNLDKEHWSLLYFAACQSEPVGQSQESTARILSQPSDWCPSPTSDIGCPSRRTGPPPLVLSIFSHCRLSNHSSSPQQFSWHKTWTSRVAPIRTPTFIAVASGGGKSPTPKAFHVSHTSFSSRSNQLPASPPAKLTRTTVPGFQRRSQSTISFSPPLPTLSSYIRPISLIAYVSSSAAHNTSVTWNKTAIKSSHHDWHLQINTACMLLTAPVLKS